LSHTNTVYKTVPKGRVFNTILPVQGGTWIHTILRIWYNNCLKVEHQIFQPMEMLNFYRNQLKIKSQF